MIEPGTPTWKGGQIHRSSMIDLVIASNSAQVSMVEIATDLYTGSDHETLCWEINDGDNDKWETHGSYSTLEDLETGEKRREKRRGGMATRMDESNIS
jgi:hypothetical protein